MKITLYVPREANINDIRTFLRREIAESQNIKSKATRKAVIAGLSKIERQVDPGHAYFTDGCDMFVDEYDGIRKMYHCGNEYKPYEPELFDPYLLVVVDSQEATIGTTDGERITVVWSECSLVPNKHKAGGQSANRFARDRERALKHWLRKVIEKIETTCEGRNIIIGGPGMTKDVMIKDMPVQLRDKIERVGSVGYTDISGLYECLGISRYEKVK